MVVSSNRSIIVVLSRELLKDHFSRATSDQNNEVTVTGKDISLNAVKLSAQHYFVLVQVQDSNQSIFWGSEASTWAFIRSVSKYDSIIRLSCKRRSRWRRKFFSFHFFLYSLPSCRVTPKFFIFTY